MIMYATLMDEIAKEIQKRNLGIDMGTDQKLGCLLWMDDVALISQKKKELQEDIANRHNGTHHLTSMTMTRIKATSLRPMDTVVPNKVMRLTTTNRKIMNRLTVMMNQTTSRMTLTTIMRTQTTTTMKPITMKCHKAHRRSSSSSSSS